MFCAKFGWNWPSGSGGEYFLISSMYFHYFVNISLGKGQGSPFEETWIPFTQGWFVPSLVEIGPVVLEKKMKMWNVYRRTDRQTDRQTDDGRQVIRKAHLSFQLRWPKNSIQNINYNELTEKNLQSNIALKHSGMFEWSEGFINDKSLLQYMHLNSLYLV